MTSHKLQITFLGLIALAMIALDAGPTQADPAAMDRWVGTDEETGTKYTFERTDDVGADRTEFTENVWKMTITHPRRALGKPVYYRATNRTADGILLENNVPHRKWLTQGMWYDWDFAKKEWQKSVPGKWE
jgi:hypothetical protein